MRDRGARTAAVNDQGGTIEWVSATRGSGMARRRRGPSKAPNRKRAEVVATIALEVDVCDPVMRSRLERMWSAGYQLRRAVQRDVRSWQDAYWAASKTRDGDGQAELKKNLGLTLGGVEARAAKHRVASGWMPDHVSAALAQHIADEVWAAGKRNLTQDASGKRTGRLRVGSWWDFTHLPGRARSHTKTTPSWETWRLVGTLAGHLSAYAHTPGTTLGDVLAAGPGLRVLDQPTHLSAPVPPVKRGRSDWWGHDGALAVVFTGLPAGDLVLPVRLPSGSGQFPRLAHFLAHPDTWHKIDMVRVRDRRAPGGWRHYAHLLVEDTGWTSPAVAAARLGAPMDRVGGVDANVSNLAVVSMPADPYDPAGLLADYESVTPAQRECAKRQALAARRRARALDRSRRASNPAQYSPSPGQAQRAARRAARGQAPRTDSLPKGPRVANKAGTPARAYRKDTLTASYRKTRADQVSAGAALTAAKRTRARQVAVRIVAVHGPHLVIEDCNMTDWARRWGKGVALFTPGMLTAALERECAAAGGTLLRASTHTTALSQQCPCGTRARKALSQRAHDCPDCGTTGDRDLVAAAMAACVTLTNPNDPGTARVDPTLREALKARVAAQQEGLSRSTTPSMHTSTPAELMPRGSQPFGAGHCRENTCEPAPTPEQAPCGDVAGTGPRTQATARKSNDLRVNS